MLYMLGQVLEVLHILCQVLKVLYILGQVLRCSTCWVKC